MLLGNYKNLASTFMKKILTVLGARPQFIKASVVSAELARRTDVQEILVHTGQHFDANMSEVFFNELGMTPPKYHLNIHGGTHGAMTGEMLAEVEKIILSEKPAAVLVYGDTNSTLAGALAAAKLHVPVAHVEAGLRSFNMRMPEEINRVLTDRISTWLFTPTEDASRQLAAEGFDSGKIFQVGDVMYDVALQAGARVDEKGGILGRLNLRRQTYILSTVHRAENTDDLERLTQISKALATVSQGIAPVVWPMHPRTRQVMVREGLLSSLPRSVHVIDPVGYLDMVQLEKYSKLIITDSGGVQKEAFFHKIPCVTMRDETEWVELVQGRWNYLVPPAVVAEELTATIDEALASAREPISPYGDGTAASQIVQTLCSQI